MKNQILYVEDNEVIRFEAGETLTEEFWDYKIILAVNGDDVNEQIDKGIISLEHLVMVCTDGNLGGSMTGWEVVELLRDKGYEGQALYTGGTVLPPDKEYLYSEVCYKSSLKDNLVDVVRKYLNSSS